MANLKEKVQVELDNIEKVLAELPESSKLSELSILELAGSATLLHSFYNGMENILKQICLSKEIPLPSGASWHRDLVSSTQKEGIISSSLTNNIQPYLAFRHFLNHSYALDLYADRMEPLVSNAKDVYQSFKENIENAIKSGDK